jgi:hypothetical protein
MMHLTEEDLILHYYGETEDAAPIERHLDTCPECRAAYGSLERVLNVMDGLPVPERAAGYEAEVWRRLRSAGPKPALWRRPLVRWPVVALALASLLAVLVVVRRPATRPVLSRDAQQPVTSQDRILDLAVSDYLDRSGIVLTELANAGSGDTLDITGEQERAADLLAECRLYHQTALRAQDEVVAGGLDELERVLVEITHAPSRLDAAQIGQLRERLRSEGLLFRIRVLSSNVRSQGEHKL